MPDDDLLALCRTLVAVLTAPVYACPPAGTPGEVREGREQVFRRRNDLRREGAGWNAADREARVGWLAARLRPLVPGPLPDVTRRCEVIMAGDEGPIHEEA